MVTPRLRGELNTPASTRLRPDDVTTDMVRALSGQRIEKSESTDRQAKKIRGVSRTKVNIATKGTMYQGRRIGTTIS
jgi:hypothetical protein